MFHNSLPGTAQSYLPAANANALNAVLTGSDANVVDLRGTARTSVDSKSLQTQINGMFGNPPPATEPPDPKLGSPQAQEINKLFQSPQPATGTQQSATTPRPAEAAKTKGQINDLFSKPDPLPHN